MRILFILLLSACALYAYEMPQTLYTANKYFVTFGEMDFEKPIDEVATILLKYNDYSNWALNGMQGIDKESEGLIIYFTEIDYSPEQEVFIISFDVNLIWPFGSKGNRIDLKAVQNFNEYGELISITLTPQINFKMVKEVLMEISLRNNENSITSISYLTQIKLAGLLDLFFSLKSYKKNIEWYILKLTNNLSLYLNNETSL